MLSESFKKMTKRLVLRPLSLSDYEVWKETYLTLPHPKNEWDRGPRPSSSLTLAKFKIILKNQKKHRADDFFYDLVAFEKKSGQIVGYVSLMDISRAVFQNAYLGYGVLSRYWGQGYGKEMIAATMEIAFKDCKLHRLEAGIDPRNKRSLRLAKSVGMRREGLSKRRLYLDGEWKDMVIYAICAEELGIKGSTGELMRNRS